MTWAAEVHFDVSIIEISDGVIGVLATNSVIPIWVAMISILSQWMIDEFKKTEGVDLSMIRWHFRD